MKNEPKSEMPETDTGWQSKGSQLARTQRLPLFRGVGVGGGYDRPQGGLLSKSEEKETVPPTGTLTLLG